MQLQVKFIATTAFWLAALLQAQAAPPCPNLSGKYVIQGEDGQVHITVSQQACSRIEVVRVTSYLGEVTTEKHLLKLDGSVQNDRQWFGRGSEKYSTSARFAGSVLQVKVRSTEGREVVMRYSRSSDGGLLEQLDTQPPILARREN